MMSTEYKNMEYTNEFTKQSDCARRSTGIFSIIIICATVALICVIYPANTSKLQFEMSTLILLAHHMLEMLIVVIIARVLVMVMNAFVMISILRTNRLMEQNVIIIKKKE
jgi:hypothetical protein